MWYISWSLATILFMGYHLIMQQQVIRVLKKVVIRNMTMEEIDATLDRINEEIKEKYKK